MKKSIVLFLTIALLLTMVVGCSSNSSSQTPAASAAQSTEPATSASSGDNGSESPAAETREPINLILSHYQTPGCSVDVMINDWCQKVTDATDGLVTFTIYSGGSLGAAKDHYDMVRSGTCDIAYSYYGIHAGVFKTFETFSLPMLGFQTAEQASEAAWDFYENYDYATEEMSEVHLLLVHSCSPCVISTKGFKIESAADLKGKTLRIASGPINQFFTALGASTATVAISDIYENMQKGIMDGYVGGINSVIDMNLYEQTTNILTTPTQVGPFFMWMNLDTWNELPDWAKEAFNECGGMAGAEFFGSSWDANDKNVYADIEDKYNIELNELSEEEYANWIDVADEITGDWISELDGLGYDGQGIVDTITSLRDEYAPQ